MKRVLLAMIAVGFPGCAAPAYATGIAIVTTVSYGQQTTTTQPLRYVSVRNGVTAITIAGDGIFRTGFETAKERP